MNKIFVLYEKNKIQVNIEETFESFKRTLTKEFNIIDFDFQKCELYYVGQSNENVLIKSQEDYKIGLDFIKSSKRILNIRKRVDQKVISSMSSSDLRKTIIYETNPVFSEDFKTISSFSDLKIEYIFGTQKSINPSTLLKTIEKINRLQINLVSNIEILPSNNKIERIKKTQVVLGTKTCLCNSPITSNFCVCKQCEYRVLCPMCSKNHNHQIKKFSFNYAERSALVLNQISNLGWNKEEVEKKMEKNNANYSQTIRDLLTCLSK